MNISGVSFKPEPIIIKVHNFFFFSTKVKWQTIVIIIIIGQNLYLLYFTTDKWKPIEYSDHRLEMVIIETIMRHVIGLSSEISTSFQLQHIAILSRIIHHPGAVLIRVSVENKIHVLFQFCCRKKNPGYLCKHFETNCIIVAITKIWYFKSHSAVK